MEPLTHLAPAHVEPVHTESLPAMDEARIAEARGARDGATASRPDHSTTTRRDGSAPAG